MTEAGLKIKQRRERVGVLLHETDCTFEEIARQVGLSDSCVRKIQKQFFPGLRADRRIFAEPVKQRREAVGVLLRETDLSLSEISTSVGISRNSTARLRRKYFPEFPRPTKRRSKPMGVMRSQRAFRAELIRILRSSGAMWCSRCRQVKCLADFSPFIQKGVNGKSCKKCIAERMRIRYQNKKRPPL